MPRISAQRERILVFLQSYIEENGFSPCIREICDAVGLSSTATVHYHLNAMEKLGLIDLHGSKKRAITITTVQAAMSRGSDSKGIPILGTVTAGMPILAVEDVEGYLPWEQDSECFALRVRGDSMIGAHIVENDLVVVRPQQSAQDGEIVVALLEDEATVKRLHFSENGYPWLLAENPAYEPIDAGNAKILGVVRGVVRQF